MPNLENSAGLWRSYEYENQLGVGNPYKLMCSAIIFQAAVDCEAIKKYGEGTPLLARYAKGAFQEMSIVNVVDFINSDWIEWLLSWTDSVTLEGVRENLLERLGVNEAVPE